METFTLHQSDADAVALALAELSIARPGWCNYLGGIAKQINRERLFDQFRQNHSNALAARLAGESENLNFSQPDRWPH